MKIYRKNLLQLEKTDKRKKNLRIFLFCFLTLVCVIHFISTSLLNISNIKVTAHRGSSFFSPENTIASVLEAIALDVDYIEIDVQLTKDNQVILLHDSSFKRTAGVEISPWNLNYSDIQNLDVGTYKNTPFQHSAPLLEEILTICPQTIILNIELKDYGHSTKLPEKVVSLIEEYEYVENCVISSKSFALLEKVNQLNPDIKTGLIINYAFSATNYDDTFLSFYAVHYSTLTPSFSLYVHSKGKELHCWTPNSEIAIKHAINSGVDNIITDKVSLAKILILAYKD